MERGCIGIALAALGLTACEDFREVAPDAGAQLVACANAGSPPPAEDAGAAPGACIADGPARPIGPLAGSRVAGARVRLRWELPPGADGAELVFCDRRACDGEVRRQVVTGTSALPRFAPRRTQPVYWRVSPRRGGAPCGADSVVWWYVPEPGGSCREGPAWRAAADAQGDGVSDLLASGHTARRIYLFSGGRGGITNPRTPREIPLPQLPGEPLRPAQTLFGLNLLVGDLDGDGQPELTAGAGFRDSYDDRLWIFPGAGGWPDDGVVPVLGPGPGSQFWAVNAVDVDGDGYGDLVTKSFWGNPGADRFERGRIDVYRGGPGLRLSSPVTAVRSDGSRNFGNGSFPTADVDNDGQEDLLVALAEATRFQVHLNDHGRFSATPERTVQALAGRPFPRETTVKVAGDLNGDGALDLVFFRSAQFLAVVYGRVRQMPNFDADGPLAPTILEGGPGFPEDVAAGDFTGDGVTDLVVSITSERGGALQLFPGSPEGLVPRPLAVSVQVPDGVVNTVATGDYDADGILDVVASDLEWNGHQGRAYWFRGRRGGDVWAQRVPGYLEHLDMQPARMGFALW